MIITKTGLDLLADNKTKRYVPLNSPFLCFLEQDYEARIRELEEWNKMENHRFKRHNVYVDRILFPIAERDSRYLTADHALIELQRQDHFYCSLYFVDMHQQEKSQGFHRFAQPFLNLYLLTPLVCETKLNVKSRKFVKRELEKD